MVSDKIISALVRGLYCFEGDPPVAFDYVDPGEDDGVYWAAKKVTGTDGEETDVIVLRGTTTILDVARDLEFWTEPLDHGLLGPIYAGFANGLEKAVQEIISRQPKNLYVAGHSLGGGRTGPLCGLLKLAGIPIIRRVAFGEPRSGAVKLAHLLADVPSHSYRNVYPAGHDRITDLPSNLDHPSRLVDVCAPPPFLDPWLMFSGHHMQLYDQAMDSLA